MKNEIIHNIHSNVNTSLRPARIRGTIKYREQYSNKYVPTMNYFNYFYLFTFIASI
jgi:hypothetical protein